ncbi:MAG: phosphoribosylamine--glycine ligase, partial [Nitrospinae bacterium]|nr:phosphoribosylamine--glycine ligase [Nitrospinota bacterium]
MKILIIGSGGREHTLAWKIAQSKKVKEVFIAPGNAGTSLIGENVDIAADDIHNLLAFAKEKEIDLTVVGPEQPLILGIVNIFEEAGIKVFGPSQRAAILEGSKVFTKDFCLRYDIPTAHYKKVNNVSDAKEYAQTVALPVVVKADGIAAGKGVYICHERKGVEQAVQDIMVEKIFGDSGNNVVFEDFLDGDEISLLYFVDGETILPLETARDHKAIFDGNKGPNTGGMGVFSPADFVNPNLLDEIYSTIVKPTVKFMCLEDREYKGILYAGIIIVHGKPYLLEYNCRFGDPECQAILPRLKTDLVDIMLASIDGTLDKINIEWKKESSVCVVMAAGGYPGSYKKGDEISGLNNVEKEDLIV